MSVLEYLDTRKAHYRITEHRAVYSARQLARIEHVKPSQVAKPVIIQADKSFFLCVLPADCIVDLYSLQHQLNVKEVRLATEYQLKTIFNDAELGAEAPIGNPYDLPVLMDTSLTKDREIVFLAGSHCKSVWMELNEYIKLVNPSILTFSMPDTWPPANWIETNPFWPDSFI